MPAVGILVPNSVVIPIRSILTDVGFAYPIDVVGPCHVRRQAPEDRHRARLDRHTDGIVGPQATDRPATVALIELVQQWPSPEEPRHKPRAAIFLGCIVEGNPARQVLEGFDEGIAIVLMVGEDPAGAGLLVHRLLVVQSHIVTVEHVVANLLEERAGAERARKRRMVGQPARKGDLISTRNRARGLLLPLGLEAQHTLVLEPIDLIPKLPDLRSAEGILDHREPLQIQIIRLIIAEDLERSILACRQERWVLARATELHGRVPRQACVVASSRRRLVTGGPACGSVETEALPQYVRPLIKAVSDVVAGEDLSKDGWVAPHHPSVPQISVEDHSSPPLCHDMHLLRPGRFVLLEDLFPQPGAQLWVAGVGAIARPLPEAQVIVVQLAAEVAARLQPERASLLVHVHERNPYTDAARKCGPVTVPALRPLAALPPVVALDALGFVPAQGVFERFAELRVQHEGAADRVVDVALVCVDEMVGACRRRNEPLDGDLARVHGVHMPDEPVALVGREE